MYVVVIDTSVITGDVIKSAGRPAVSLVLGDGEGAGARVHGAPHLGRGAASAGEAGAKRNCDLSAVEKLWWDRYVKLIRFVPTADLPPGDPELEKALGSRDPSDLPTLSLASLIAPAVVLAADRDLVGIGLAYERWWDVPEAVRKMVAGQGSTELAARVVFGGAYGTVALVCGAVRALRRPWVAAGSWPSPRSP